MHAALQFLIFWALAFLAIGVSLLLLSVYYALIGNDLTLRSAKQEAIIAAIASLIEGTSVWLAVTFLPPESAPLAIRAFIVPILIVAIIYKLGHLEDWSRYDIALFMFFQIVMVCSVVSLFAGQFKLAFMMLGIFAAILVIVASFARSM